MQKKAPPTDRELFEIESLACDATPGPWEPQVVLDYRSGEATRVIVRGVDEDGEVVIDAEGQMTDADQRYIAALHPDAVLRLVRELRRLRRVEQRFDSALTLMNHLSEFLERRNLTAQAQRFVEVRAQVQHIHPEVLPAAEQPDRTLHTSGAPN
jgi:hypothetical protein